MGRPLIYLDLDRTLYRTDAAGAAVWKRVHELYPSTEQGDGHDWQRKFYVHKGDAYAYDFTAHVTTLGLDAEEVYQKLRATNLTDGRFEYDGTQRLVRWLQTFAEVRVLTYGIDDYQRFKASLCPSLVDVPVETTLGEKGEYLQDKGDVWLVDDKPLHDRLPANVRFIQVLHDAGGPDAVVSLDEVMVALKSQI